MRQIFASFFKEWLLLWRDKVGLIFLFILPMCLVLFITLTENEDPAKPRSLQVMLFNQDQDAVMATVVKQIKKIDGFKVTDVSGVPNYSLNQAKTDVTKGKSQALIVIPASASQNFMQYFNNIASASKPQTKVMHNPAPAAPIQILVDPTLPSSLQSQLQLTLQLLLKNIQANMLQKMLAQMQQKSSSDLTGGDIVVNVEPAQLAGQTIPNDVQQNVPAWALFGMFFIITPLSGVLVKERTLGVMNRLHIAPVSFANLIFGKILAFVLLNLVQLALMLAVGMFILPLFGLPALNVWDHLWQILVIGICASLAATGFGMLVGSFVRTPEQANVIGPFLIVIAAALGGIFVPVYLLPDSMQKISAFSPMHWAHVAFLDVFLRDAGISQLWPNLLKLLALSAVTTWLALMKITYRPN